MRLGKVFFSTASGWGTITIREHQVEVMVEEGRLEIQRLVLERSGAVTTVQPVVTVTNGKRSFIDLERAD